MRIVKEAKLTIARLSSDELDLIEDAMIALAVELNKDKPTVNGDKIALVSTTLTKLNTIRKCSIIDGVEVSPSHGG